MMFEWDEKKAGRNLEKHKISFYQASLLFDGRFYTEEKTMRNKEKRLIRTGVINDRYVTVVWTKRHQTVRIISARRARKSEIANYEKIFRTRH